MSNMSCHCGSDKAFSQCCEPIIKQVLKAQSPEQLMRSRFSAFYCQDETWLKASWHVSTRPESIQFEENLKWLDLTIINTSVSDGSQATVEFEARYFKSEKVHAIHENSRFIKQDKQWFYLDGDYLKTTFKVFKIGRNDDCPCGSQLKYKNCCGNN